MKRKIFCIFVILICLCSWLGFSVLSEASSSQKIDIENFNEQSCLNRYNDGSWTYTARIESLDFDADYVVMVDITSWGEGNQLSIYPQMTIQVFDTEDFNDIVTNQISIQVCGNVYEYQLFEGHAPWNKDTQAGVTFLLPSDQSFLEDLASANTCIITAETDLGTLTWSIPEEDYKDYSVQSFRDMVDNEFLNNVEANETSEKQLTWENTVLPRKVYKSTGNGIVSYYSGPDPEDSYSFSEDSNAITQAMKSVFYVEMYDEDKNCLGNASGFVAFDDHYFVTNEHVIDGASYLIIWDENDKSYILDKVIAIDKQHDIAILEFPEGSKYTSLWLDPNDELKRGMPIVVIGSKGLQVASSIGIIGAIRNLEQYSDARCIQYSAFTSRESNGGCLFGDNGKVIGINSAISDEGQYIGVAVPSRYVIELYSRLKSKVYNVMDASGSDNSDTLNENGKKKEDYTIITGGKINTIVAIPRDLDLDPFVMDEMNITIQEFLNRYNEIRKTTVKDAPAITNRKIEDLYKWNNLYYINSDPDSGVGTRLMWKVKKGVDYTNFNLPLNYILQIYRIRFYDKSLTANTKACLAVFSDDNKLMEKLIDYYTKNDCRENNQLAGLITSEGYLIMYSGDNLDAAFYIYYVGK